MQPTEVLLLVTDALEDYLLRRWLVCELDIAYLRQWATQLAITDLLDAALRGAPPPRLTPPGDDSQQLRLDL